MGGICCKPAEMTNQTAPWTGRNRRDKMRIDELISSPRTDAELAAWLSESKWHAQDAINFSPWRGTPAEQVDTYYRVYRMAKSIKEAPAITPQATDYLRNVASGDSYFDEIG